MRYYFKTSFKRKRKNFLIRRRRRRRRKKKKKQKGKGLKNIWNKFNKLYKLG